MKSKGEKKKIMMAAVEEQDEPSAARTESEKNVCNNCPNWTASEASQNGLFAYDKQALFLRNSVLAELSVYGH